MSVLYCLPWKVFQASHCCLYSSNFKTAQLAKDKPSTNAITPFILYRYAEPRKWQCHGNSEYWQFINRSHKTKVSAFENHETETQQWLSSERAVAPEITQDDHKLSEGDSCMKLSGMLNGKFALNPQRRRIWAWLELYFNPKKNTWNEITAVFLIISFSAS